MSDSILFRNTGFTAQDLADPELTMPFPAQVQLIRNAQQSTTAGMALRVGQQLQVAAHGSLGTAMQSAPELRSALHAFIEFIDARASFFRLSLDEEGQQAVMRIDLVDLPKDLHAFFTESLLHSLNHCLRFFSGQPHAMTQIELYYADPSYGTRYQETFQCPTTFEASCSQALFPRPLLALPSPESDHGLFSSSTTDLRTRKNRQDSDADLVHDIQRFLLDNPGKVWTLRELAPRYAISGRTLIRRLQAQGTTYQTLRDEVYKPLACEYLRNMSVEAAAVALGFADTASFRRTFKRWYGVTPGDWKIQQNHRG
ncbi:MAG: AraC family transcriptional regulator [Pseudomonadota bacterium]